MFLVEFSKSQLFKCICLLVAAGWLSAETITTLETPGLEYRVLDIRLHSMASDGSLLIAGDRVVYHCNPDGYLINKIVLPDDDKDSIGAAYYSATTKRYWLVVGQESLFYDEQGQFLGNGFRLGAGGKVGLAPVGFIEIQDRLFAVALEPFDLWRKPNQPMLTQVKIVENTADGLIVAPVGNSFHDPTNRQKSFNFNFKLHWIVSGPYHGDLFVAHQLSTTVRHFVQDAELVDVKKELKGRPIHLQLPGFIDPPMGMSTQVKNKEEYEEWWHTWSQLTGFFPWGNGFLAVYYVPHPSKRASFRQLAQKVNRSGKALGEPVEVVGTPVGVGDEHLFLLRWNEEETTPLKVMMPL